ncbi:hypothetical protein Hoch_4072 [Haliangium ochraceum DSM 14365]|uniref:Yip1 domain-containing protein n=2 Tax=Haliangium ochraceum TaxID=80816 RepID=D0LJJ6_HALO1|nr:hypothetical protein Hoch_4072 [Haliangium ochraceum DSM 14365]
MSGLVDLLYLPPEHLGASVLFLASIIIACELLRVTLSVSFTSGATPVQVVTHVLVNLLTAVIQPLFLAVVLVLSIVAHPERGLLNLLIVLALYGLWYGTGQATLLVRRDSQGADLGFMSIASAITFVPGLVALAVC